MTKRTGATLWRRSTIARFLLVFSLAAVPLGVGASSAAASVTIGQLATSPTATCTFGGSDFLQLGVGSGNTYVVPPLPPAVALEVSSWSHNAKTGSGQTLKMKVWRQTAASTYQVVGHDGPQNLTPSTLNTFQTSIAVKPGDILGLTSLPPLSAANSIACTFSAPGDQGPLADFGDRADGASLTMPPASFIAAQRLNITAVVSPVNAFTLGKTTRNKKRGTATEAVNVPNPGQLTVSGKGVNSASASAAAVTVNAPGAAKVLIKATGKKKKKLNSKGKVKVSPKITYTPTGGSPKTQSLQVKLKKKL
jgi:hypothetical protein